MVKKVITKLKTKKGNAVVISLIVLSLVLIIIGSIANIYINKLNSVKNINKYYDMKINEELNKR